MSEHEREEALQMSKHDDGEINMEVVISAACPDDTVFLIPTARPKSLRGFTPNFMCLADELWLEDELADELDTPQNPKAYGVIRGLR